MQMTYRIALILLLSSLAFGGIIEDVRGAIAQNNFSAASSELQAYRVQHGVDPEYLEALSWMARGSLASRQLEQALSYSKQTESLSLQQLKKVPLDSSPHLAIALGAAFEVQAQVLMAKGERRQAVSLLQNALAKYGKTSIRPRLQKNLNLLSLVHRPAPPLDVKEHLGSAPALPLSKLHGSPVLLFFWAHWCGDCKNEAPIITRLRSEYAGQGLVVMGPTQLYGYAARGQEVSAPEELGYIETIRQRFYPGLLDIPIPVSKANFEVYGASTTPTLVLIDRNGQVALYHPGAMSYDDLRTAIESVIKPAS
jgi:thiol-disulfide isomerase/thioredoxin